MTERNSETLRDAMFANIEGLKNGSIKPDQAKASATCAMAICKTVELDIRATELLKKTTIDPLRLTSEPEHLVVKGTLPDHVPDDISLGTLASPLDDEEVRDKIEKGLSNGLKATIISQRLNIGVEYVRQYINETRGIS